jgi:UDP-N-acetylglucosamine/UDP-N-acetylgalactosamine diphosphorylase
LAGLEKAPLEQQKAFLLQLQSYSPDLHQQQKQTLLQRKPTSSTIQPLKRYDRCGNVEYQRSGQKLLEKGKVGCLILAGGQGSRLKGSGPKGCTPVSLIKHKSLFQLFFERTRAASIKAGCPLPLAIMTSPLNHAETLAFLNSHDWFGLPTSQVTLFSQSMAPLLDDQGNWMLEEIGKIAEAPDGNGGCLRALVQSGVAEKWKRLGVDMLNVVLIDNPLADPFDAELCGFHAAHHNEITLKCIQRKDAQEKVGIVVIQNDHLKVIEYSEQSEEQKNDLIQFPLANISSFCFSLNFVEKMGDVVLPWHMARKEVSRHAAKVWKCETFIFDLLDYTKQASVLVYPREECFAPLKNATGEASLDTLRKALLHFDRQAYHQVSSIYPHDQIFELDPSFYYPTPQLIAKWRGKPLPQNGYISAD